MGGDQSRERIGDFREVRVRREGTSINVVSEEEVPYNYTSFSVGRPDTTKKPSQKDIVVVRSDPKLTPKTVGADPVLQRLEEIPVVFPVIRSSVNMTGYRDLGSFEKLDHRHVLLLCLRYQQHLKECAEAVSFDQAALTRRLKDLDLISSAAVQDVGRMQQHVTRMSTHLQRDMNDIQKAVQKADSRIRHCVPLMRRLNNVLPEEDRLEDFELMPESSGGRQESDGQESDGEKD